MITPAIHHAITPFYASILGVVEGLTEFLPISSTGHLILTGHWLGLNEKDPGVAAFEIIIQSGALLAVIGLYWRQVQAMALGLLGRNPAGLRLALQLLAGFFPAAVVGLLAGERIKAALFGVWPVVLALIVGGVLMLAIDRWRRHEDRPQIGPGSGLPLEAMTIQLALLIGIAQCLAMWPGTSRSMITIVAAMLLGFNPRAAAEFSFLLALPTLGAATAHDLLKHHHELLQASGGLGLTIGFVVSMVVAFIAIKFFLSYLTRHGMAAFGWYRIALAILVAWVML